MLKTSKPWSIATLTLHTLIWSALTFGGAPATLAQTDYGKITIISKELTDGVVITLAAEQNKILKCTTRAKGTCSFQHWFPANRVARCSSACL
jgi:hypothetical protein